MRLLDSLLVKQLEWRWGRLWGWQWDLQLGLRLEMLLGHLLVQM